MIIQYLTKLGNKNVVLASASPRRKEILQNIGLKITIEPSSFIENLDPNSFAHPKDFVIATARGKAQEVAKRLSTAQSPPDFVIGADTCVTLDGTVYGKPKDRDHASSMLNNLSGRSHEVLTGVCLMVRKGQEWQEVDFSETTTVNFATLSPQVINAYIDTKEPMDKAGGYGIQALGGMLIEGIQGDYYNVMGFPLHRFCQSLVPVLEEMFS